MPNTRFENLSTESSSVHTLPGDLSERCLKLLLLVVGALSLCGTTCNPDIEEVKADTTEKKPETNHIPFTKELPVYLL